MPKQTKRPLARKPRKGVPQLPSRALPGQLLAVCPACGNVFGSAGVDGNSNLVLLGNGNTAITVTHSR